MNGRYGVARVAIEGLDCPREQGGLLLHYPELGLHRTGGDPRVLPTPAHLHPIDTNST